MRSCTCTYVPYSTLQCLLYVILSSVIIVLGLNVEYIPSLCGELFSQNTQLYTISTINHGGYLSNGNVAVVLLTLFFTVLMYLLITGKCSFAAHIFIDMPFSSIICCICLNCPSPSIACILNPGYNKLVLLVQLRLPVFCSSCLLLVRQCQSVCCMTWS